MDIIIIIIIYYISVQYAWHLKGYFQEWLKNPHWSFSCCLAFLLPVNDLQGDIRDVAGTNVLKTQLQSGEFEMVTLQTAVQDSGAIDVTLEEDRQDDGNTVVEEDDVCQVAKNSNKNCDQETQTELFSLLTVADVMLHKPVNEGHLKVVSN